MAYRLDKDFTNSLDRERFGQLIKNTVQLGVHPSGQEALLITQRERQTGLYVLGKQGSGKTGFLQNLILQDIMNKLALIVLDAHGDLTDHCIAQLPSEEFLYNTYVLDMADEQHPFGLNPFNVRMLNSEVALTQAIDRITHPFEIHWPEIFTQQYAPRFLRAATFTLLANQGSTLLDMYRLLTDDQFRFDLLKNVKDQSVHDFWKLQYDEVSTQERYQRVRPLMSRLELLFMGRSLIRNILGQRQTTIDFRNVIENKETIFIKLPVKTLKQDAGLIGSLLVSEIYNTLFSFSNVPEHMRPGFSLVADEFEHYATHDFAEMFTEGRKFGVRLALAHQYRRQLPDFLRSATLTAGTIICFQPTQEDAREMAEPFLGAEPLLKPENIDTRPVNHLINYGSKDYHVQVFTDFYLRFLKVNYQSGKITINNPGFRWDHLPYWVLSLVPPETKVEVDNPIEDLNHLLYEVMKQGNPDLPISPRIVKGFSTCGWEFYKDFKWFKSRLLEADIKFPRYLVVKTEKGLLWVRKPENGYEQLYHFLFHLRQTMRYLAENPLGKKTPLTVSEIASMLMQLPERAIFVKSGHEVSVLYTDDNLPGVRGEELRYRLELARNMGREKYCGTPLVKPERTELQFNRWEAVK